MSPSSLRSELLKFTNAAYPEMDVKVEPWAQDSSRLAITFVEEKFSALYPAQRYHQLVHLIPKKFFEEHLTNTIWFELAPGEKVEDLRYLDDELVEAISESVLRILERLDLFNALDELMCPEIKGAARVPCHGDYRNARQLLLSKGMLEDELFDVFHVLMAKGGHCDCEILYNSVDTSRLKSEYWRARAEQRPPYNPHVRQN